MCSMEWRKEIKGWSKTKKIPAKKVIEEERQKLIKEKRKRNTEFKEITDEELNEFMFQ